MADSSSRGKRALLLTGVILWVVALLWVLNRKGIVTGPRSDPKIDYSGLSPEERARAREAAEAAAGEEVAREIVINTGPSPEEIAEQERLAALARTEAEAEVTEEAPTYRVWFESERDLGVCKVSYEGGSKTANLHVDSRQPEGKLEFTYRCGGHRGRGSIEVKPKGVNGVLFCKTVEGIKMKVVRKKDGRCASR